MVILEELRLLLTKRLVNLEGMPLLNTKMIKTFNVIKHSLRFTIVALERGNGRRVDGARVVVDCERGRTRSEWVPRRLGGGKGDKRRDRDTERLIRDLKKNHP